MVLAWALTLPAAGAFGAATYGFSSIFGSGAAGPVIVSAAALSILAFGLTRRARLGAAAA
jgi:hypothetical protein